MRRPTKDILPAHHFLLVLVIVFVAFFAYSQGYGQLTGYAVSGFPPTANLQQGTVPTQGPGQQPLVSPPTVQPIQPVAPPGTTMASSSSPSISSIAPDSIGDYKINTDIVIAGAGFTASSQVVVDGTTVPANKVTFNSATQLTYSVAGTDHQVGMHNLYVNDPAGQSNTVQFKVRSINTYPEGPNPHMCNNNWIEPQKDGPLGHGMYPSPMTTFYPISIDNDPSTTADDKNHFIQMLYEFVLLKEAGVYWVRMTLPMQYIEYEEDTYDWTHMDMFVDALAQTQMNSIVSIGYSPMHHKSRFNGAAKDTQSITDFVVAFLNRVTPNGNKYSEVVSVIEGQNEPEGFASTHNSLSYQQIQNALYAAVKSVDNGIFVLSPGFLGAQRCRNPSQLPRPMDCDGLNIHYCSATSAGIPVNAPNNLCSQRLNNYAPNDQQWWQTENSGLTNSNPPGNTVKACEWFWRGYSRVPRAASSPDTPKRDGSGNRAEIGFLYVESGDITGDGNDPYIQYGNEMQSYMSARNLNTPPQSPTRLLDPVDFVMYGGSEKRGHEFMLNDNHLPNPVNNPGGNTPGIPTRISWQQKGSFTYIFFRGVMQEQNYPLTLQLQSDTPGVVFRNNAGNVLTNNRLTLQNKGDVERIRVEYTANEATNIGVTAHPVGMPQLTQEVRVHIDVHPRTLIILDELPTATITGEDAFSDGAVLVADRKRVSTVSWSGQIVKLHSVGLKLDRRDWGGAVIQIDYTRSDGSQVTMNRFVYTGRNDFNDPSINTQSMYPLPPPDQLYTMFYVFGYHTPEEIRDLTITLYPNHPQGEQFTIKDIEVYGGLTQAQCGNGILESGEQCDPPQYGRCPTGQCNVANSCQCDTYMTEQLNPSFVQVGQAQTIDVLGQNFDNQARVLVDGQLSPNGITLQYVNPTNVRVSFTAAATQQLTAGNHELKLRDGNGVDSLGLTFNVNRPPVVTLKEPLDRARLPPTNLITFKASADDPGDLLTLQFYAKQGAPPTIQDLIYEATNVQSGVDVLYDWRSNLQHSNPVPVAHYSLDDPVNIIDNIEGNHGTPYNGVSSVGGQYSNAAAFDGSNDYIELPNAALQLLLVNQGSIEFWLQIPPSATSISRVFGWHDNAEVRYDPSGRELDVDFVQTENVRIPYPQDGQWHHVVITWNTNGFATYLDGVPLGTASIPFRTIPGMNSNICLGTRCNPMPQGNHYEGNIDEFALYDVTMTPAQVQAHYTATSNNFPNDQYYWHVIADDGNVQTQSSTWSFTVGAGGGNQPGITSVTPIIYNINQQTLMTINGMNFETTPPALVAVGPSVLPSNIVTVHDPTRITANFQPSTHGLGIGVHSVYVYNPTSQLITPTPASIAVVECTEGAQRNCNTGQLGICAAGTETCSLGRWGSCVRNYQGPLPCPYP